MNSPVITLDGHEIRPRQWKTLVFTGRLSQSQLAGIDLALQTGTRAGIELVEGWQSKGKVEVVDPFCQRTYQATFRVTMSQFQNDRPDRYYEVEIREIDVAPTATQLELNGELVPILWYKLWAASDDLIHQAILRLTPEQFHRFQLRSGQDERVSVKRVGVDDEAIVYRYGGVRYWSQHEEDGEAYYKQVITFLLPDVPIPKLDLILVPERVLANAVKSISTRLHLLVTELVRANVLSVEQKHSILGPNWNDGMSEELRLELQQELTRVDDVDDINLGL